jgi:hypothetical protein
MQEVGGSSPPGSIGTKPLLTRGFRRCGSGLEPADACGGFRHSCLYSGRCDPLRADSRRFGSSVLGRRHNLDVSDWVNGAIAAGAALVSSGLTGAIALRASGQQVDAKRSADLAAALQAYGYSIDTLTLELGQLPPDPGHAGKATQAAAARLPTLSWSLGQISRHSIGRPAMRALDVHAAAFNRLVLIAPSEVLNVIQDFSDLLSRFAQRNEGWDRSWRETRASLVEVSREAVERANTPPRRRAPSARFRSGPGSDDQGHGG